MRARGRGEPLARRLQLDAAVEVVDDRRDDQAQEGRGEAEAHEIAQERQPERVERHVGAELRVVDPERLAVGEQQVLAPLTGGRTAGEQAEEQRDADDDAATDRFEGDAVALEVLLLLRHAAERGAQPVGQPHREGRAHAAMSRPKNPKSSRRVVSSLVKTLEKPTERNQSHSV